MSDPAASDLDATAQWYDRFARLEARGQSRVYEELSSGVARDSRVLALITELPRLRRQPNLVLACSRLLGAPLGSYEEWSGWLVENWPAVRAEAEVRLTQTNEARRCAVLLPALAAIDGPLALLEVGTSAGLCLYPDRYSYDFDGALLHPDDGPSTVLLECTTNGSPPERMPEIVWRAGSDLHPLDVTNDDDARWLETLVWPEQHERRERLRSAMDIVAADPPLLRKGDVNDVLNLAAEAPTDATLVVISSGVLVYLVRAERDAFAKTVRGMDATWLSFEAAGLFPAVADGIRAVRGLDAPDALDGRFALSVDQQPRALVGPHGQFIDWL